MLVLRPRHRPSLLSSPLPAFSTAAAPAATIPHLARRLLWLPTLLQQPKRLLQHSTQQLRQAQGQLQLSWRKLKWETGAAAVYSSLTVSSSGQRLLTATIPIALLPYLLPGRFTAVALERLLAPFVPLTLQQQLAATASHALLPAFITNLQIVQTYLLILRAIYLSLLFLPMIASGFLVFRYDVGRPQWMELMGWTLEHAGPAFIKWGQWASTRPDLFPVDLCDSLERLQTNAPRHAPAQSVKALEDAFGRPVADLFDEFEMVPIASGSIAQIHRGKLSAVGAAACGKCQGTVVAVKVRHPGVTELMQRDFCLMEAAAKLAGALPGLRELRLDESIRQFGGPLKEQLDLTMEAEHLKRFNHNFRSWRNVSFPTPMHPLVAPAVLVESFEEGALISCYVKTPGYKHNSAIAETGMKLYLQMLLQDNFIHADLHPGNVLVKEVDPAQCSGVSRWLSRFLGPARPNVILLDTGMVAELNPADQQNLVSFFRALTTQDGEQVARMMLAMSEQHTCKNPEAFVMDLASIFDKLDAAYISQYTQDVFSEMIETLRTHHVTLKSTVSTVVVTTLVLEGWSTKLDPNLHILDTMRELLHAESWGERVSNIMERVMYSKAVAMI
ncbi:MAG: hypothetical protein WDW36_005820 [Sanguina aurantia]